jgi:hypothetical protein
MKKPLSLLVGLIALFGLAGLMLDYDTVYRIGYGTFTLLALVISGTFFWLWFKRSTPLALGMAFGWAGAATLMAWRLFTNLLSFPDWMQQNPLLFVFLSVYLVGAILHLEVIGRSFSLSRVATFAPVCAAIALSVAIAFSV